MHPHCPVSPPEFRELVDAEPQALVAHADYLARLRELGPVVWVPELEAFAVTRYEEIAEVVLAPDRFSSAMGHVGGPRVERQALETRQRLMAESEDFRAVMDRLQPDFRQLPVLTRGDPPGHSRHRSWVNRLFVPRRVARLEDNVRSKVHALIDGFADRDRVEFIGAFAGLLPVQVIAEQLGVLDHTSLGNFKRWSDDFVFLVGNNNPTNDDIVRMATSTAEFAEHFTRVLAERRETGGGDDFISTLARMEDPDEPITNEERIQVIAQLVIGGNQTTTKMLASGAAMLGGDPELAERLRADPDLVPAFVEELLRLHAPVTGLYRVAREDTELAGVPIPAGSSVLMLFGSANREEDVFPAADSVRLDRPNLTNHLTFGRGVHYCVGAPLARLEGVLSFGALLERVWPWQVEGGEMIASYLLHGHTRLDLSFPERVRDLEAPPSAQVSRGRELS